MLDVREKHPDKLTIEMHALATRVIFEGKRAVGVEYLKGARLYRAQVPPSFEPGVMRTARASREVILSGGTTSTPQLLMLSGIGPAAHLREKNIPVASTRPASDRTTSGV